MSARDLFLWHAARMVDWSYWCDDGGEYEPYVPSAAVRNSVLEGLMAEHLIEPGMLSGKAVPIDQQPMKQVEARIRRLSRVGVMNCGTCVVECYESSSHIYIIEPIDGEAFRSGYYAIPRDRLKAAFRAKSTSVEADVCEDDGFFDPGDMAKLREVFEKQAERKRGFEL